MLLLILLTWEKENLSLQHLISSSDALQLSLRDLSSEIMKAIAKFLCATSPEFISFGKIKSFAQRVSSHQCKNDRTMVRPIGSLESCGETTSFH